MKKIYYFALIVFGGFAFSACQKEVSDPVVSQITFSVDVGKDSIVTEGIAGIPLKITIITDANICSVWPAGIRDTLKSELNPAADSVDVRGTVFIQCDDYNLYQTKILTGVNGYNMNNLLNLTGFTYVYGNDDDIAGYTKPGSYDIAFVLTKDGEDGRYKSVIVRKTLTVN
jgi:hypothetical protein